MRKRWRFLTAKPGELRAGWGAVQFDKPDLCTAWGGEGADRADSSLLMHFLSTKFHQLDITDCQYRPAPSLLQELEKRGYDITTLKFSIQQKRQVVPEPSTSEGNDERKETP